MALRPDQLERLAIEQAVLRTSPFAGFKLTTEGDAAHASGWLSTHSGNQYGVVARLPGEWPGRPYFLLIVSPSDLRGHNGRQISGPDGHMHVWSPHQGAVSICHCSTWNPATSIFAGLVKALAWLEALEAHRRTGQPIGAFLPHA